jgi:DNA repair exonuclease SbcCD ATPase subunit
MNLPILKKVTVEHLSLYTRTINTKISPGLNLIIGGNGIGKTTLVNAILFGLVGNEDYERVNGSKVRLPLVDKDYFQGRLAPRDYDFAKVTVTIGVGRNEICVTRALERPRILNLTVKRAGKRTAESIKGGPSKLEEKYQQLIRELLDVKDFEDFVFVVANLLIFDEARRTLAWNSNAQNRIIRLLFLDQKFDFEYSKQDDLYTQYDTRGRHKSEERKNIRRTIEEWLKAKKDRKPPAVEDADAERQKLEFRLAELQIALSSLGDEIQQLEEFLSAEIARLRQLNSLADEIELKKTPLLEGLNSLENQFYSRVYEQVPAEYAVLLEGLVSRGICQFCNSQGKNIRETGRKLKEQGECIVCRSPITYPTDPEDASDERETLVQEINSIRAAVRELDADQKGLVDAQNLARDEIKRIQHSLSERARARRDFDLELSESRSMLIMLAGDESPETYRDDWLENQNNRINKLNEEVDGLYRKRDEAGKRLKDLNEKIMGVLRDIDDRLNPLFSHFASEFLGTPCELVVTQRKGRKPVAFMYPRFLEKERANIHQVSESQRFFIDQAFRMALISWFAESRGQLTFCIVETPEGSLDLAYEKNVADMYLAFANQGHAIIVTSNLNSSNFLNELSGQIESNKGQILDLLAYGRLSSVQTGHLDGFNDRLATLKLPPLEPTKVVDSE